MSEELRENKMGTMPVRRLVLHCSYSLGGVVCSSDAKAAGFTDLGRPSLFEKTP